MFSKRFNFSSTKKPDQKDVLSGRSDRNLSTSSLPNQCHLSVAIPMQCQTFDKCPALSSRGSITISVHVDRQISDRHTLTLQMSPLLGLAYVFNQYGQPHVKVKTAGRTYQDLPMAVGWNPNINTHPLYFDNSTDIKMKWNG